MMPADFITPLIDAEAAARLLGISQKTLRAHVQAGELPYISLGKGLRREHRMFDAADLRNFIEARKTRCHSKSAQAHPSGMRASSSAGAAIFYLPERQIAKTPSSSKNGRVNGRRLISVKPPGKEQDR